MDPEQQHASDRASQAGAFLFAEGGPLPLRKLGQLVGTDQEELAKALTELAARLEGSGIALVRTDMEAGLAVAPQAAEAVRAASLRDLDREIGDAGLEVLAILLYRGPSTRAEIDYIRGVNTTSTLRTLLMRGLVLRVNNPSDAREYLYRATTELLAHLGVTDIATLPDHARIAGELASFEQRQEPFEANHGGEPDTRNNTPAA